MNSRWKIHPDVAPGMHGLWIFDSPGRTVNLATIAQHHPPVRVEVSGGNVPVLGCGEKGVATEFTTINQAWNLGCMDEHMNVTTQTTVGLGFEKSDSTNRDSVSFQMNSAASTFKSHTPWLDGVVYWDFGAGRISKAGLSDTLYHTWIFTTGPRGMELWRDGILEQSDAGQTPTRTLSTNSFFSIGGPNSDLAKFYWAFIHRRQWPRSEIQRISRDPWRTLVVPGQDFFQGGFATPPTTGNPWLYYALQRVA